ncbi:MULTISPECIES: hypothetical protein [Sphingobacterium]|uniref:hypothetical protein n=1 Tax=Sphingobacterium TaxID=28453 RepID=UPI002579C5F8|nr:MULTISPECIES: hypothetical protein [Sphingobacterium]
MKKLMLSLALSGLMLTGFAQEKEDLKSDTKEMSAPINRHSKDRKHDGLKNKNPEELAKIKTDRMDQKLKFTDQQRKEVYAFHLKQAQDHKKIAAERKLYREKMRRQRAADHKKMMALLTPEQQKTLKDSYAENHKMHKEHWRKDRQMRKGDFQKGVNEKTVDAEAKTT